MINQNKSQTKRSEQNVLVNSFDEDFNILAVELVGYDGSALQRLKTNASGEIQLDTTALDDRYYNVTGDIIKPTANSTTTHQVQQSDGTVVLNVDTTNGRVGIGTTDPVAGLTVGTGTAYYSPASDGIYVTGKSEFFDSVYFDGNKTHYMIGNLYSYAVITIRDGAQIRYGTDWDYSTGYDSSSDTFRIADGSSLTSNVRLTLDNTGNVGIGVIDPDTKLEVFGSTGLKISFDATDNTTLVTDTAGDLTISPSGTQVIVSGNIVGNQIATPLQTATLGVGVTTLAITSNVLTLTGDGGGNTLATLTGGVAGQLLTIIFVDALITITDTDAHTADTVDLSAAFTGADDTVLQLVSDGTSWYEVSRSIN